MWNQVIEVVGLLYTPLLKHLQAPNRIISIIFYHILIIPAQVSLSFLSSSEKILLLNADKQISEVPESKSPF